MSLGDLAALGFIVGAPMVQPKIPFSLFDFKYISMFEERKAWLTAAAGAAIALTDIYECPEHKFALLLGLTVNVTKTTATALLVALQRAARRDPAAISPALISESAASGYYSWPSGKAAGAHVMGWHLCFLFPGDKIRLSHALTAAETIVDSVSYVIIEYIDPRYEEK